MKLLTSPTSPYARKVLACAIARDIDGQIDLVATDAQASPADLLAANPLSKIPTLVTGEGTPLYDSRVICEYLDTIGDAPALFPASGRARWIALKQQALADGIMDAAVRWQGERRYPEDVGRGRFIERQRAAVLRAIETLESDPPHTALDIGSIATACALGYLDFRFADVIPWRQAAAQLASWFSGIAALPPLARTSPPAPSS